MSIPMLPTSEIENRLEKIYRKIPELDCHHCHTCCGPIIWFKPEEIIIREYLQEHAMGYKQLSTTEFKRSNMRCPYLSNDRCTIYPVRPLVCRLQGHIPELRCRYNKKISVSLQLLQEIKKEFNSLVTEVGGNKVFYSTRKIEKS